MPGILRELTRLQERDGWLSEPALRELAERLRVPLHRLESLSTFYPHFRRTPPRGRRVALCRDVACNLAGGRAAAAALRDALAGRGDVEVCEVSCLGRCDGAPAAAVGRRVVNLGDAGAALAALAAPRDAPTERPVRRWEADPYPHAEERYGTLRDALGRAPHELLRELDASGLRGMGGAGFPTGRKWTLVAREEATPRYVICTTCRTW